MSRIGKSPIPVPSGVEINVSGQDITVKGPKGSLDHTLPDAISLEMGDGEASVTRADDERESKALHGLSRSLVNNMVIGVSEGFRKDLEIIGVGYRANAKGKDALELALGFSHSVTVKAPAGIEFDVPEPTKIGVIGIDKQVVGQVAAEIRAYRKPEPYKGKGVRYVGERVIRKAGKAGK
ncbi:MAG: 50S ribosomal protein L6 [Acidimicrobiales bacterium]